MELPSPPVTVPKQRDLPTEPPFTFELVPAVIGRTEAEDGGEKITSCTVQYTGVPPEGNAASYTLSMRQRQFVAAMRARCWILPLLASQKRLAVGSLNSQPPAAMLKCRDGGCCDTTFWVFTPTSRMLETSSHCHRAILDLMTHAAGNMNLSESVPRQGGRLMPLPPRIARNLHEPAGWLTEISALYRAARRGQLATEDASRLAYLCAQAGKLAKDVQFLHYVEKLHERLKAMPDAALPAYSDIGEQADYASEQPAQAAQP